MPFRLLYLGAGCVCVLYITAGFLLTTPFLLCNFLALIILIRKCVCKPMKTGRRLKWRCKVIFQADGEVTAMKIHLKITLGI